MSARNCISLFGVLFSSVLYECETWSLTLREERRLRVSEKGVLRGIFGPKRDEVTGEWRKLHNEELNMHCSPDIVRVIRSRIMRWAVHVAGMVEGREIYTGFWWGSLRERDHLGDQGVDGRIIIIIIIRCIFGKWDVGAWARLIWLGIRTGGGHL